MRTIEIEEDIYNHLLHNTFYIGEGASEILRRLLGLVGNTKTSDETSMVSCIKEPRFQAQTNVLGRFLFILSWLHGRNPNDFSKVLNISGTRRKYFAKTKQELVISGKSVFPKQIPDTEYWVVTNNDTPKKGRMLSDVMRILGYVKRDIDYTISALVNKSNHKG